MLRHLSIILQICIHCPARLAIHFRILRCQSRQMGIQFLIAINIAGNTHQFQTCQRHYAAQPVHDSSLASRCLRYYLAEGLVERYKILCRQIGFYGLGNTSIDRQWLTPLFCPLFLRKYKVCNKLSGIGIAFLAVCPYQFFNIKIRVFQ